MEQITQISYIQSDSIVLSRVCRESCGYCSFRNTDDGLLPHEELISKLGKIRSRKGIEVLLICGEEPVEYPHIQMALKREECGSFLRYLEKACQAVLQFDLLPVLAIGNLDGITAKTLANVACSIRLDLVPADLSKHGEAHGYAPRRNRQSGRESIEHAHDAGLPYNLGILIGIGETRNEREEFIREIAGFCASDPYMQDIRVIPFQPCSGTPMRERPPLSFGEISLVIQQVKEVFPVHQICVPINLFSRFMDLVPYGLNDIGSIPGKGSDVVLEEFPFPPLGDIAEQLLLGPIILKERLPLTTRAAFRREELTPVFDACRYRIQNRGRASIDLVSNQNCFVCGKDNPQGLKLKFVSCGPYTASSTWTGGPDHQGYSGILHGGLISTLLDEIMAKCLILGGLHVVTAEMTVKFLKPAPLGIALNIFGSRLGGEKNLHFTKGTISDADGTVYAEAEGKYIEC